VTIAKIARLIHLIRGKRVLLETDLAALYDVEVRVLKRQVRRNMERFPPDFLLEVSREEQEILRCQFGTLRWGQHSKYLPYAFTEQGVAMLSGVLHSPRAIQVNIEIMRAFVQLRHALIGKDKPGFGSRLARAEKALSWHETELGEHAADIHEVFATIRRMIRPRRRASRSR
jgi:hypothetical protein